MDYNQQVNIDLHVHSTASDGSLSPLEILETARDLQLGAVAITDHDTIDGSKEALAAEIPPGLKFLTGVEISATPPPPFSFPGSMHILGYAIRLDDPALNQALDLLQDSRKNRNPRIVDRLNNLGVDITLDEVLKEIGGNGQLGRPHIARLMVKKGFAESINNAFDRYLATGKPAYVDKFRIDSARAIEIIKGAGGIPVLAHPFLIQTETNIILEDLVLTLKSMGLMGIEVYYPEHTPEHIEQYTALANRHELLITGGTDFHGSLKPDIQMGTGKGNLHIPYALYEKLILANKPGA
ncbi:PHP domain-containing protein [Thermodesulfobacteriota bacterium]